jgi:hypothetical protein
MTMERLDRAHLEEALAILGRVLADRGLQYRLLVVGGSALLLEEAATRTTQDVDVAAVASGDAGFTAHFELPDDLREAVLDVAATLGLPPDWMNAGAAALVSDLLPSGYERRLRTRSFAGLTVSVLGRADLLRLKLYAGVDEGPGSTHLHDVIAMAPLPEELAQAIDWVNDRFHGGRCPGIEDVRRFLEERL